MTRRESRERLRSSSSRGGNESNYGTLSSGFGGDESAGSSAPYVSLYPSRGGVTSTLHSINPAPRSPGGEQASGDRRPSGGMFFDRQRQDSEEPYRLFSDEDNVGSRGDRDAKSDDQEEGGCGSALGLCGLFMGTPRWKLQVIVGTVAVCMVMVAFMVGYIAVHGTGPGEAVGDGVPDAFVPLRTVMTDVVEEIRYAGYHNFVGRPIDGYDAPVCWLTRECAEALRTAGDLAAAMHPPMVLKVYDCYRPMRAVADFVQWGRNASADAMKAEFYPTLPKSRLFPEFIAPNSSHARGSTIDVTLVPQPPKDEPKFDPGVTPLVPCTAPASKRWPDNSIDMGTGFDCFSDLAWTASQGVGPKQRANREKLVKIMEDSGMVNYDKEWWHFTLKNEPFPHTFFNFPIKEPET